VTGRVESKSANMTFLGISEDIVDEKMSLNVNRLLVNPASFGQETQTTGLAAQRRACEQNNRSLSQSYSDRVFTRAVGGMIGGG
jgi:hypothetical protein